jgi:hypothetical protein
MPVSAEKNLLADTSQIDEQNIIDPSAEELNILFDLAMKGELVIIEERAHQIEKQDRCYAAFVAQLIQFAQGFAEEELLEFVQGYMEVTK